MADSTINQPTSSQALNLVITERYGTRMIHEEGKRKKVKGKSEDQSISMNLIKAVSAFLLPFTFFLLPF
jgi:hypothetical protein